MASVNPFDLLGDDDNDDLTQLIAKKAALAPAAAAPPQQANKPQAKMPSKPLPPSQAVKETKSEGSGGGRGGGRGFSRGRGSGAGFPRDGAGYNRDGAGYNRDGAGYNRDGAGFNRDRFNNENSFNNNGISGGFGATEDGDAEKLSERRGGYVGARGSSRGGRRGGFNNEEIDGERPKRVFERRSGTGRGSDIKRDGSGRGNWGSATDEIAPDTEELGNANESLTPEKQPGEEEIADASKDNPVKEPEEKEPEEKEMTLDEYQKILEEKRKALLALKVEERKVPVDKEFESMQQLSGKKTNDEIFIKLGSEKDKKKEIADKDEKAKKSVSINEFLKPTGGDKYYPGGRGRGRGRGGRGGGSYSGGGGSLNAAAPSIEDPGEFPNLK